MPSTRRVITFRPDDAEEQMLEELVGQTGLSAARVLGMGLRLLARQGETALVTPSTKPTGRPRKKEEAK